jgi:hypothetical protein
VTMVNLLIKEEFMVINQKVRYSTHIDDSLIASTLAGTLKEEKGFLGDYIESSKIQIIGVSCFNYDEQLFDMTYIPIADEIKKEFTLDEQKNAKHAFYKFVFDADTTKSKNIFSVCYDKLTYFDKLIVEEEENSNEPELKENDDEEKKIENETMLESEKNYFEHNINSKPNKNKEKKRHRLSNY